MRLASTLAGLALLALLVVLVPEIRHAADQALHGDTDQLRKDLHGANAAWILLVLMLVHAVVFYPADVVTIAAGLIYGFWIAIALVLVGWLLSALLSYEIGAHAAGPFLHRIVGRRRFERLQRAVERGGVRALLLARLIPIVPFSATGYVAGAAGVSRVRFAWTTVVGFAPLCIAETLFGSVL